ncbi:Ycf51 family protein [Cyanobium sp. WAJ14-Wanaka]|uniref:Ycf51 family protein n=1 Tax=Cyanobium sp. WAJ14-Wanaka TaxID=2823725 RepID=UPI0020CBE97F|nr:Ycf51 family protein [Cyanobium sp. WAJ14-Wanaka]MCP9774704.1 Ycf51 family protein [Cyanobium sp. WAJ14-Wanaka]
MAADPILFVAGQWLGAASGALAVVTITAYLARWGIRFRLVGVTSFTALLSLSCLAFAISYTPRVSLEGAVSVPLVFDNGSDLVIAAAPADLPPASYEPTVQQVAQNLRSSGRSSPDGLVHVRLRRVETVGPGVSKPVVLAEVTRDLASGSVTPGR